MIVTVTPTIMDGPVVRWYARPSDLLDRAEPTVSVSRHGVRVGTYLHKVPDDVMATAQAAYEALRADPSVDVSHLATHRRVGLFGPLEPAASRPFTDTKETS